MTHGLNIDVAPYTLIVITEKNVLIFILYWWYQLRIGSIIVDNRLFNEKK